MKIEWTLESWGSDYPPENANEIIAKANKLIDAFAETHDEDETAAYSEWLWELYCSIDEIPSEYLFVDERGADQFVESFDDENDAINAAESEWEHLTESERKHRKLFFVCYTPVNSDNYSIVSGGWTGWYNSVVRDWKETV